MQSKSLFIIATSQCNVQVGDWIESWVDVDNDMGTDDDTMIWLGWQNQLHLTDFHLLIVFYCYATTAFFIISIVAIAIIVIDDGDGDGGCLPNYLIAVAVKIISKNLSRIKFSLWNSCDCHDMNELIAQSNCPIIFIVNWEGTGAWLICMTLSKSEPLFTQKYATIRNDVQLGLSGGLNTMLIYRWIMMMKVITERICNT